MDNASKALIMAGAILIAVAIVGIGIYIFSASNSLTNNAVDQIDTIAVQMFNQTLTQYATDLEVVNGTRTLQLLNVALVTDGVDVYYGANKITAVPTGNDAISSTKAYEIDYDMDYKTGYITKVTVTKKSAN